MIRSVNSGANMSAVFTCTAAAIVLVMPMAELQAKDLQLQVPVKTISQPDANTESMESSLASSVSGETTIGPTMPGGKLPQYQLGYTFRNDSVSAEDAHIRLILALPDQPVVVDAVVTIDGQPYRQPREDRVRDLVAFARDPEAWKTAQREAAAAIPPTYGDVQSAVTSVVDGVTEVVSSVVNEVASEPDLTVNDDAERDENVPAPVATYVAPKNVYERIERFMDATGTVPSVDEVRWQLTNWGDGPVLLFLNDHFQRFRADQSPVFKILDRDRNGIVSSEELQLAVTSFQECDLNRDDLVQHTELAEVASDPRDQVQHAGPGKLIYQIPDTATALEIYAQLNAHYSQTTGNDTVVRLDANNDGEFGDDDLQRMQTGAADVLLEVSFSTTDGSASALKILSVADDLMKPGTDVLQQPHSATLQLGTVQVDFSAVQSGHSDQISVGAVNDGYPMLPLIDPNDDGKFTIRELRELPNRLAAFDRDGDGSLSSEENRSVVRLCFGLGPHVHTELAGLRSIQPSAKESLPMAPNWFSQMDVNNDNDVTRREFPGTDEQFSQLDIDNDRLIHVTEAVEFEGRSDSSQ